MTDPIVRAKSPEEDELESKLSQLLLLESELAQKELELTTLQAELQSFEGKYLRIIGLKIAKLDEIRARIAEAFSQLNPTDKVAANDAANARSQSSESTKAAGYAQNKPDLLEKFKPSENLKSLYRQAAKRFHPDLATDENDRQRRTKLMVEINNAYMAGDENHLIATINSWEDSPDNVSGEDIGAKLIRVIRKIALIRRRLSNIRGEIEILRKSDLYHLFVKVDEAEKENRDILLELSDQLDKQIAQEQERLNKFLDVLIKSNQ